MYAKMIQNVSKYSSPMDGMGISMNTFLQEAANISRTVNYIYMDMYMCISCSIYLSLYIYFDHLNGAL